MVGLASVTLSSAMFWNFSLLSGLIMMDQKAIRDITQKALASTVLLVAQDAKSEIISRGSGFVVKRNQIVTNFHVVENAAIVQAKLVGKDTFCNIKSLLAIDRENDLVLLGTDDDFKAEPLDLADSEAVQISDPIYVVGNPQGFLEGTVSQGIISGVREFRPGNKHIQMTAPISRGSSGGPVLNSDGKVVGISVGSNRDGQLLNFAIPSNCLNTLLTKEKPADPLLEAVTIGKLVWEESSAFHWVSRLEQGVRSSSLERLPHRTNDIPVHSPWGSNSSYRFSLRNQCLEPIKNVRCYVSFYTANSEKIYRDDVVFPWVIPAGAAKSISFDVDARVKTWSDSHKVEIISFDLAEQSKQDDSGNQNLEGVTWFGRWSWAKSTAFGFSLRNQRSENIGNVHCLVTFKDNENAPIRSDKLDSGQISAGKTKLISFDVDPNVILLGQHQEIRIADSEKGQSLEEEGVIYDGLRWLEYAFYTFSLRNQLNEAVRDIRCHVLFYAEENMPIDSDIVEFSGVIPAKMTGQVNGAIDLNIMEQIKSAYIRVVDFKTVN